MSGTLDHGLFYNSNNGDRVYDAESFEHWLKKFFTTGVFTGDCQVTAAGGMTVEVAPGYANVDGKVRFFESPQILQLETANSTYSRIDTIVIERNDTDRDVTLKVVTGNHSLSPVATAPVRENGIYQLVLAEVQVQAGATGIVQGDITDTRLDDAVCGIVAAAVEHLETSQYYAQIQADLAAFKAGSQEDFDAWFEGNRTKWETWFNSQQTKGWRNIYVQESKPESPETGSIWIQ